MQSGNRRQRCLCVLVALATVTLVASSGWARGAGVLGTIERNASRLARTRMADREVTVVSRPGFSVWVRANARVIGVSKGLSQQGFFLGRDGKLSATDRATLGRMLQQHAPALSSSTVRSALRGEMRAFKTRERTLQRQDPLINRLLGQAASSAGAKDRQLWQGSRGSLVYRPGANVLVGSDAHGQHGFFLSRSPGGLGVQAGYQEGLRQFLHQNR